LGADLTEVRFELQSSILRDPTGHVLWQPVWHWKLPMLPDLDVCFRPGRRKALLVWLRAAAVNTEIVARLS
jgi:hypothetical protein